MNKYLVVLDYKDNNNEHVHTSYKVVEERNTLDVMLNVAFGQVLDKPRNEYDQKVADGELEKNIAGIYTIDENGMAVGKPMESKVGVPMGKVEQ